MKLSAVLVLTLSLALSPALLPAAPASATPPAAAKVDEYAGAQRYIQVYECNGDNCRRITLADAQLVIEIPDSAAPESGDAFATGKKQVIKLDPAVANAAWEKIMKLDVLKWRGGYDARDLGQEDSGGTEWSMEARIGKDKRRSRGVNAFPGLSPLGIPQLGGGGNVPDSESAYSELMDIFKALSHGK